MQKYWEEETPLEAQTKKSWFRFFPRARRLQVCRRYVTPTGEPRIGQVTTVDLEDLANFPDAIALLQMIVTQAGDMRPAEGEARV